VYSVPNSDTLAPVGTMVAVGDDSYVIVSAGEVSAGNIPMRFAIGPLK
jgi:hypothetical protein